jgi:PIN domain nuclease of toxin-antitoxin system
MNYLLDTHVLIWAINEPSNLPNTIKSKIENTENNCFISIASFWEIAIKVSLKKLSLGMEMEDLLAITKESQFEVLNITILDIIQVSKLPFHHHDPFDRLLISQALTNNLVIITRDKLFGHYGNPIDWV